MPLRSLDDRLEVGCVEVMQSDASGEFAESLATEPKIGAY